jgi:hypothetical protein
MKMRQAVKVIWCLVVCLCAVLFLVYWNPGHFFRPQINWTVESIEQSIENDLPAQCNRKDVEKWLHKQRILSSYFEDTLLIDGSREKWVADTVGVKRESINGWICGYIPDAEVGFLLSLVSIFSFFSTSRTNC